MMELFFGIIIGWVLAVIAHAVGDRYGSMSDLPPGVDTLIDVRDDYQFEKALNRLGVTCKRTTSEEEN